MIYESCAILKIKEKAGIEEAIHELEYRKQHKELLPLPRIGTIVLYTVRTEEIKRRLVTIDSLYQKVCREKKMQEIVTRDVCENEHLAGMPFRAGMVYVGSG